MNLFSLGSKPSFPPPSFVLFIIYCKHNSRYVAKQTKSVPDSIPPLPSQLLPCHRPSGLLQQRGARAWPSLAAILLPHVEGPLTHHDYSPPFLYARALRTGTGGWEGPACSFFLPAPLFSEVGPPPRGLLLRKNPRGG